MIVKLLAPVHYEVAQLRSRGTRVHTSSTGRSLLYYVSILILVIPFAALAAGVGGLLGMTVAVAGWGVGWLDSGAATGAGIGVAALAVCVLVFVVHRRQPKVSPLVHAEKVNAFVEEMKRRGVQSKDAAPIFFRIVWALGFQVPPPHFLGIWGNFCWAFGLIAPCIISAGSIYWLKNPNTPLWAIWVTTLVFLGGVGWLIAYSAATFCSAANQFQLPPWDRYTPCPEVSDLKQQPEGLKNRGRA